MESTFQRLSCLPLAILCFVCAEMIGGNGFIATFCGGLFLGVRQSGIKEKIQEFGEAEGTLLILFIFLFLGLVGIPAMAQYWDIEVLLYSVLSLTAIRMLSVAISMIGAKEKWQTIMFIGWFGPRGIASLLYVLMVITQIGVTGYEIMLAIIMLTVTVSVVAHGLSAVPLVNLYGKFTSNKN